MSKTIPHNTQTSLSKSSFLDYLDEGRLTDWLTEHGKNILYGLAGLIGLLVIIYTFSSAQTGKAEQEYLQAARDFAYFSKAQDGKNQAQVQEAFDRLTGIISRHPELHAAYDGAMAQTLLNRAQDDAAKPYALATLARVKSNDLPFYRDYAETTLLISQQNFQKALENAMALQQKMNEMLNQSSTHPFGDELFALNLLRIGMLQQETGDKAAELKTWQEWKRYAGLNSPSSSQTAVNPQAFRAVIQQLAIGSIALPDYISYRENILKK